MKFTLGKHQSRGFSLVEVLVTTLILGVGLAGAAKFQVDVIKSSSQSQKQVEAVNFAKAKMEELLHFSTAEQYEAMLTSTGDVVVEGENGEHSTYEGSNALYTVNWKITESDNTRGAKVTLKVNWGESDNVYLSTIVSNTTPSLMTLTTHAPARDPVTDPIFLPVVFPVVDPSNVENSENICKCNGSTAVAFNSRQPQPGRNSFFVRVSDDERDGGGMSGSWYDYDDDGDDDEESHSEQKPVAAPTEGCDLCCESANAVAQADQLEQAEKYYAQLEALLMKKVRFGGDQVIGSNGFDPRYLRKGYQTNNLEDDIKKYLINAGDDHESSSDWSSDGWGDGDDDDSYTEGTDYSFTAACGYNYDPPPPPTPAEVSAGTKPKPVPKSTRCIFYRGN